MEIGMPSISELAARPPTGDREREIVLGHFHEIRAARANGWSWVDIGKSLDRDPRALAAAFRRVEVAIKKGKLDAARLGGKTIKPSSRPAAGGPRSLIGTSEENIDALRAVGVRIIE
jgi:hypothetical protein